MAIPEELVYCDCCGEMTDDALKCAVCGVPVCSGCAGVSSRGDVCFVCWRQERKDRGEWMGAEDGEARLVETDHGSK